ncbi:hypothetical protein K438DRAFT_1759496 [Mycena galopus ATCC 62051]|nr:hypothetical protein K438DRAFT_1759496 [Mycena galopus ATCC 62051]
MGLKCDGIGLWIRTTEILMDRLKAEVPSWERREMKGRTWIIGGTSLRTNSTAPERRRKGPAANWNTNLAASPADALEIRSGIDSGISKREKSKKGTKNDKGPIHVMARGIAARGYCCRRLRLGGVRGNGGDEFSGLTGERAERALSRIENPRTDVTYVTLGHITEDSEKNGRQPGDDPRHHEKSKEGNQCLHSRFEVDWPVSSARRHPSVEEKFMLQAENDAETTRT